MKQCLKVPGAKVLKGHTIGLHQDAILPLFLHINLLAESGKDQMANLLGALQAALKTLSRPHSRLLLIHPL